MTTLTGNKDVDGLILMNLNDYELSRVCRVNKYVNSICNDDMFWLKRLLAGTLYSEYDVPVDKIDLESLRYIKDYLEFKKWKKFYIFLNECISHEIEYNYTLHSVSEIINRFIPKIELLNEFIDLLEFPKWINSKIFIRDMVKRDRFKYFYYTKSDREYIKFLLRNVLESSILNYKTEEKIKSHKF